MENYQARFQEWRRAVTDGALSQELDTLLQADADELRDRFGADVSFGTGGLRGIMGAGTNRMNLVTIGKATQGLADHLKESSPGGSVAVAYDSRQNSELFARHTAAVLAANGFTVQLFPRLMPTPVLSFATRHLSCLAGVCITASHNPADYNGYKVYNADGCQATPALADAIGRHIARVHPFADVRTLRFEDAVATGHIRLIGEEVLEAYLAAIAALRLSHSLCDNLQVVYTPLNGAGLECVTRMLQRIGVAKTTVVPEQSQPDGCFPSCPYPNPEDPEALALGLTYARRQSADLLLATDPDCDRLGVAVRHQGAYRRLSGNEVGILLLHYIAETRLAQGTMPLRPVAVKTIVTTDMAKPLAEAYGIELRETLTGFKYIGEQLSHLALDGEAGRFLFGFEESCGYLSGAHARDKDAVNAAVLVCDMAAHYKRLGLTLADVMRQLYTQYGWYRTQLRATEYPGPDGMAAMEAVMNTLRKNPPVEIAGRRVLALHDYLCGRELVSGAVVAAALPVADVLEFRLAGNNCVIIRPSGTEPKLKMYITATGATADMAETAQNALTDAVVDLLDYGNVVSKNSPLPQSEKGGASAGTKRLSPLPTESRSPSHASVPPPSVHSTETKLPPSGACS